MLSIKNLTATIDGKTVLNGFDLEVGAGEVHVIMGPNGAGKSTLLKMLLGEVHSVPLDHTRVRLFGEERWNVWDVRKKLGIVSYDLQRDYLICAEGRNVVLSGFYASNDTYDHQTFTRDQVSRADEVMRELGIESFATRVFGHLSTGEQRRFLLGRALVHDPPVLVLDEPTSGLDLKSCFQYLDLVRTQIYKGKTIVLVTHHLHEIPPEIDRVIFLKGGKILADGPKLNLLTDDRISTLFDRPIVLAQANGWYQALPGLS